ncbi:hypothetical protein LLG95_14055 [bacterium]|nr:hypothetical protein [bacterium]
MYKLAKRDRQFIETWRGVYAPEVRWYAAMTRFGTEQSVVRSMHERFGNDGVVETLLPEIASADSPRELLFPCYVFIRCRMSDDIYMDWAACDGVVSVLGRAWRIPAALDDREIRHLKGILAAPQRPRVAKPARVGSQAEVTAGILQGLRGRVVETCAAQVKIETRFSFLDSMTAIVIAVPRTQIRLLE